MPRNKREQLEPTDRGTLIDPSGPLRKASREIFAQMVAQGVPVAIAYARSGYRGGEVSRSQLRRSPDVDARVSWLLAQRVEADTRARHQADQKVTDGRLRLIRELEGIAYSDTRDVVQWGREPEFDRDGNVIGFKDTMRVTPSHLLTKEQAAQVKSVTRRAVVSSLRFTTRWLRSCDWRASSA